MNNPAKLFRRDFESFVRMAYRNHEGRELGDEPYIAYVCRRIAEAKDDGARCVVNLPPRHLKTFIGSVCQSAWLLARDPTQKILIVAYSEQLARDISYAVRRILQSRWYQKFFPATRLAEDRTRVADFATTEGGEVYAVSAEGSITGRGANVIIYDDPLNISEASNLELIEKGNERFDTVIMSRLNTPKTGRVIIIAHRLHPSDLSGHVLRSGGWDHIALPFIAPRDQDYDLGGRIWRRKKGDLLRPDAFLEADINQKKATMNFEALYQQFLGEGDSIRISREQFGSFLAAPDAPVVISVDPGHRPGPGHSFTVMQAWCSVGDEFFLLDQWRAQADVREASRVLNEATANCQAAAVLIEWSGYGQTLAENLQRRFPLLNVQLITPDSRSKTVRLLRHIDVIQSGRIRLPQDARWREAHMCEFEQFPNGPFDDRVDATTQFLDFMLTSPTLRKPRKERPAVTVNSRGLVTLANQVPRLGIWPGYQGLARRSRVRRIFPEQKD
jgi:predicted phage terminase large subunit-like protein